MKRRILIVENETGVYNWLTNSLEADTFDMVWTRTAREALCRSLAERFDLVLLDLKLPDMEGWKALDWFKSMHPFLPLVVLTDTVARSRRATTLGADACLEKPPDAPRLSEAVTKLLAESHSARMTRLMDALYGEVRTPASEGKRRTF